MNGAYPHSSPKKYTISRLGLAGATLTLEVIFKIFESEIKTLSARNTLYPITLNFAMFCSVNNSSSESGYFSAFDCASLR